MYGRFLSSNQEWIRGGGNACLNNTLFYNSPFFGYDIMLFNKFSRRGIEGIRRAISPLGKKHRLAFSDATTRNGS